MRLAMPTIESTEGSFFNERTTLVPTLPVAPVTTTFIASGTTRPGGGSNNARATSQRAVGFLSVASKRGTIIVLQLALRSGAVEPLQVQATSEPRAFRLVGELDLTSVQALLVIDGLSPQGDVQLDLAGLCSSTEQDWIS
jgi:hypothetical protein